MPTLDLTTARWRKSSRSFDDANCVEIAYPPTTWRKSTHSADDANCVELTHHTTAAAIRDSKNPQTPPLTLPLPTYQALLTFTRR